MANYSIVVDTSNFKPYDMSIPLNILRDYREAYYRYEDALNKIAEENGMYSLPEPEEGNYEQRRIYDQYQKYNNEFRSVTDDFAKGMNWRNAQMVRDINRRYGLEVKPVKQAVENYNKFLENKNSIRANRPEARFGKNPSVYDFVGGRTPELEMLDGEKIQATAAKLFTGVYNSSLHKDPQFKQSIIEGYDLMYKEGIPEKEALQLAMTKYNERTGGQHSKALNNYITVLNNYFDSLGIEGWDESEKQKVWGDIINGAVSAIPERKDELVVKKDLERAMQRQEMQLKAAQEARTQQMFPLQMQSERAKIQGQLLSNQAQGIANKYAPGSYQRQARMDNMTYNKAAMEYQMLLNEWNDKYGNSEGKELFSQSFGNRWGGINTKKNPKAFTAKGKQTAEAINSILQNSMDGSGQVIAGDHIYRFSNTKNSKGQYLWVGDNGKTFTSKELADKVSITPQKKASSTKAPVYNDYVRAGYGVNKGKNGKYYVNTEDDAYIMGQTDNKLYPKSVLQTPPAKNSNAANKSTIILPSNADKNHTKVLSNGYKTYRTQNGTKYEYWIIGNNNIPSKLPVTEDTAYDEYVWQLQQNLDKYGDFISPEARSTMEGFPIFKQPSSTNTRGLSINYGDMTR